MTKGRLAGFLLSWLLLVASMPAQEAVAPALEVQVRALFEQSCAQCHDSAQRAKPKGDFGHVQDLARLAADTELVTPGQPMKSDLYRTMIEEDPEFRMPPPDSDVHKPTEAEIKLVHDWIVGLAQPAVAVAVVAAPAPVPVLVVGKPKPKPKAPPSASTVFARTHVMWVHFPVALLILAALVDWLALPLRRTAQWLPVLQWCLGVSAVSATFAVIAGWMLASKEGYAPDTVALHRWLGVATAASAWVGWGLLELAERRRWKRGRWFARIFLSVSAMLVGLAGHTGGELVYGKGFPFN
jgi:uncharacterized membrane protein/mono/diheme cytochrome c family protein